MTPSDVPSPLPTTNPSEETGHIIVSSTTNPVIKWFIELQRKINFYRILLVVIFISTIFIAQGITERLSLRPQATLGTGLLSIKPSESTITAEMPYQLWMTVDQPTGFVRATITFNPEHIMLSQAPIIEENGLSLIKITSLEEANTTGTLSYTGGLDLPHRQNPVNGTFHVLTLYVRPKTTATNISTAINIDLSASQAVTPGVAALSLTSQGASLAVNPSAPPPSVSITPTIPSTPPNDSDPTIVTTTLKMGVVNQYYATKISATNPGNTSLKISASSLPKGVKLTSCTTATSTGPDTPTETSCVLTGKPQRTGVYYPNIVATSASGKTVTKTIKLEVMTLFNFIRWFFNTP